MSLLFIFALTFTLSAQQESGSKMIKKVMNALGEVGRDQVINDLNEPDLQKLMDCIESECKMDDFLDLRHKMLTVLKEIPHGDKLIYKWIKTLFKHGPVAELVVSSFDL
ncbi:uncharacterized protein M6D78_012925 [Vipera latastei]